MYRPMSMKGPAAGIESPLAPLVGRRREWATLMDSVNAVWRGRKGEEPHSNFRSQSHTSHATGSWLAIKGDIGVGKTHLVHTCVRAAADLGLRVIKVYGDAVHSRYTRQPPPPAPLSSSVAHASLSPLQPVSPFTYSEASSCSS